MDPNLKLNKGKSASSSISSIAIRFHADDEEIEEVVQSSSESTAAPEKQPQPEIVEEDSSSVSSSQLSTPTSSAGDSQSYLTRLGKRSSSLESASPSDNSSGDAWRLFKDFRGRITKTVEEKLEEIKSDRLKGSKGRQRQPKLGSKLENSSISDSEDQSEGSVSIKSETPSVDGESKERDSRESVESSMKSAEKSNDEASKLSTGSSSEKDDERSTPQQRSVLDDKEKVDETCGLFKKKKETEVKSKQKESEITVVKKKVDEDEEKTNEDDLSNPSATILKKDKKKTKFFGDRFSRTSDKKSAEVSMTFSSLKNDDSEDEIISVEYGTEADEALGEITSAKRPSLISVISSEMTRPLGAAVSISAVSRVKHVIWNWKLSILVVAIAIAHKTIDTGYFFGFMVGIISTVLLYRALDRIEEFLGLKDCASNNMHDLKTVYGANVFPIFSHCDHLPGEDPEKCVHEGWINEYPQEYSPDTYHISLTETVHIRLEGSTLRLSSPSTKISKRAYWNEPEHKKLFNRQRLYDIAGCRVQLLPVGLIHKRIWSKKYPICITLLKMSKIGVRYRTKGKITIEDDSPWLDPELDDKTPTPSDEQLTPHFFKSINNKDEDDYEDFHSVESKDTLPAKLTISNNDSFHKDPLSEDSEVSKITDNQQSIEVEPTVNEDDDDFVRISPSILHEFNLYFFARSDRQKEIWYRRLVAASSITHAPAPTPQPMPEENPESLILETSLVENASLDTTLPVEQDKDKSDKEKLNREKIDKDKLEKDKEQLKSYKDSPKSIRKSQEKKYLDYMNSLSQVKVGKSQNTYSKEGSKSKSGDEAPEACEKVMWVNAFSGRILYDVLSNEFWLGKIQEKFQRKLGAIKLPVFMEDLVISDLNFGETIPVVQNTSRPVIDEDGIWVDLDVTYEGSFRMTIDTKINLMKLKKDLYPSSSTGISSTSSVPSLGSVGLSSDSSAAFDAVSSPQLHQKSAIFDSDVEDSAESSSEEPDSVRPGSNIIDLTPASPGGGGGSNKMLRMVDRIAASKYFQQVTDNKFIKRAMEGVSNTNIALVVEVKSLSGTLVLNFPPPPSDRLWYGFRGNPKLSLSAQPKVGERMVTMLHITSWIEKRLVKEFQKILVLPNMDDLIIPVMNTELPS